MVRVQAHAITKRYKGALLPVLNDLSLTVNAGEKCIILGLNGAGKTTLIKCLLGLLRLDRGLIELNGSTRLRSARLKVGVVTQYNNFDRRLSVADNLRSHAALYGFGAMETQRKITQLSREFGFFEKLQDLPLTLSGGTLRKAVLVRCLITEPNIVIMDEPTSNIDPSHRQLLHKYLDQITVQGGSVLLSTHLRDDVTQSKNSHIHIMQRGQLSSATSAHIDHFFEKLPEDA